MARRCCYPSVEHFKLASSDAGEHVAHAVVVAKFGVFVGDAGIAGLLRPEARLIHPSGVARNEHSAAGGGNDLVPVEREHPYVAEAFRRPVSRYVAPSASAASSSTGMSYSRQSDRIGSMSGALPVEIDDDEGPRQLIAPGAVAKRVFEDAQDPDSRWSSRYPETPARRQGTGSGLQLAAKVRVGHQTSSPGPTPRRRSPRWMPAVPLARATEGRPTGSRIHAQRRRD